MELFPRGASSNPRQEPVARNQGPRNSDNGSGHAYDELVKEQEAKDEPCTATLSKYQGPYAENEDEVERCHQEAKDAPPLAREPLPQGQAPRIIRTGQGFSLLEPIYLVGYRLVEGCCGTEVILTVKGTCITYVIIQWECRPYG